MIQLLKIMDFDSDGFITPKEFEAFRTILACAGLDDCVVMDWIELFEKFADEDNKVPIKKVGEFVKLMDELEETEEESQEERQAIRNLFYFFDENGDGKLSKTEAKIGFGRCEYEWDDEMEELFESVKDSDGKVSIKGELLVIKSQS